MQKNHIILQLKVIPKGSVNKFKIYSYKDTARLIFATKRFMK